MTPIFSVSDINQLLYDCLSSDPLLSKLSVRGTVTQYRSYGNTHYITLSDGESHINAVYFNTPKNPITVGTDITVVASPTVYTKRGTLQLKIHALHETKPSALAAAFDALKQRLKDAGLFDAAIKKAIPKYPKTLALITAHPSAALTDFLNLKADLAPHIAITLLPTAVQGQDALRKIPLALAQAATCAVDAVILLRGGGSAADLAVFNTEAVVRAIHACHHPIITAIGHDCDVTLADFAADYRAATPSDAIHMIAKPSHDAKATVYTHLAQAKQRMQQHQQAYKAQLQTHISTAKRSMTQQQTHLKQRVAQALALADAVNPLKKLAQGYSITQCNGQIIRTHQAVKSGDELTTRVSDGTIISRVI